MRKFLIIILPLILLASCKSSSDLFVESYVADQADIQSSHEGPRVFQERDLETLYSNKKKVKVALFFPFSGKHRELGWSLYNAAAMSLFDNDENHNIELVLIDSSDNAVEASHAINQLKDANIKLAIGPIFSNFVIATKKNILRNSIKAISLSNNQDLQGEIDEKGAVFIAGVLPEQQLDRLVSFALDHHKKNFAIIAPNDSYGIAIGKIFKDVIERRDGTLIQSELYNASSSADIKKSVKRIVDAFSVPKKLAEGGGNKLNNDFKLSELDKNYADVILIADASRNLGTIATLIKKYNEDEREIQIMGIGGFDDPKALSNSDLDGTWFAAPDPKAFERFEKDYYRHFNALPPRISSIAYDSVAAIAKMIDSYETDDLQVENFTNFNGKKEGFDGIDGKFRFLENGLTQRNLAIVEVKSGKLKVVDDALDEMLDY